MALTIQELLEKEKAYKATLTPDQLEAYNQIQRIEYEKGLNRARSEFDAKNFILGQPKQEQEKKLDFVYRVSKRILIWLLLLIIAGVITSIIDYYIVAMLTVE